MKTRTLKKDKVNIITLGCSKNMVDSEVLSGQLLANDIDVVHENKKSDEDIIDEQDSDGSANAFENK